MASATHAAAWRSSNAGSGLAWIRWERSMISSRAASTAAARRAFASENGSAGRAAANELSIDHLFLDAERRRLLHRHDLVAHRARQHPAWLGGAGAGRHAWIDDVDVEREVDGVRPVQRLRDRLVDDGLRTALLDLGHQV